MGSITQHRFLAFVLILLMGSTAHATEITYIFGDDTGYQPSLFYSESGVNMVVTAHEVVNDNMGGTSGGVSTIIELRDAPISASTGVYDSASGLGASSYTGDGQVDVDGSDSTEVVDSVTHYIHDEGLMFTFENEVELSAINFHDFSAGSGSDDFNLAVDGITYVMDYHSGETSEYVVFDNGDDVFEFSGLSGTKFLFWLDDDLDDWQIDDVTFSASYAVPEPATIMLFILGLTGLVFLRRRES